jgi:pyruvate/oxaloacetate carboxyltransferase
LGGEVYNLDYYVNKAKALEEMGADSICIKDMAGLIAPYDAYKLIKTLKENVTPPHISTAQNPTSSINSATGIMSSVRPLVANND